MNASQQRGAVLVISLVLLIVLTLFVISSTRIATGNLRIVGNELSWDAEADLESGLAGFIIERDGQFLANVPEQPKNPFGRPLFQNLQYSDTPTQPLVAMRYTDGKKEPGRKHAYRVIAVNTVGLKSKRSEDSTTDRN